MKVKVRKRIIITLLTIIFIALQILNNVLNMFHMANINGVIMGIQFLMCLIMIHVELRSGFVIATVCLCVGLLNTAISLIVTRTIYPLAGTINVALYIITLLLLYRQYSIRKKESVTDFLTGLSNRRGLYQILSNEIEKNNSFNLINIDFSNIKSINDNYGHSYGDCLLNLSSRKMLNYVGDDGYVSRMEGACFVIVLKKQCDIKEYTQKLIDLLQEKNSIPFNDTIVVSHLNCFAGVSNFPNDGKDSETLLKYADLATNCAEKLNKAEKVVVFDKQLEREAKRKMELLILIKEALENDYFYMVYQPQYKLEGKQLRGFESLLRLKTPEGVFVSPADIIPVAEKNDLILKIDDWVIRHVMKDYRDVVRKVNKDITISINVSAKNIASSDFADRIKQYLDEEDFPAKNLEIEITEYCLVQSMQATIENIIKLREIGVQFALDDFGTGYTSLSYLSKLPVNLLKVDKSLVDNIENSQKSRDFVNAVISMGHLMGCEVISEGVENDAQLSVLGMQKCDFIQGYVWGKPLDFKVSLELAAENKQ